jgi:DNA mismatch repair ATPase MutS
VIWFSEVLRRPQLSQALHTVITDEPVTDQQTSTAFGARRLREWVRRPLVRREDVVARLEAVKELAFSFPSTLEKLVEKLRRLPDLEAIISNLHYRRVSPRRLVTLLKVRGVREEGFSEGALGTV